MPIDSCTNPTLGRLIAYYEAGGLDEEGCASFEEHLMECEDCARKLADMRSVMDVIHRDRSVIARNLSMQGVRLDELQDEWTASRQGRGWLAPLRARIAVLVSSLRRPVVWYPASGVVVSAMIAFLFFTLRNQPASINYVSLLSFEKLPYQSLELRHMPGPGEQIPFDSAMARYLADDFVGASEELERVLATTPGMGSGWLYLGVCYYMQRKPLQAITALSLADSLLEFSPQEKARWYLAQAHLLNGEAEKAKPYLMWIQAQRKAYSGRADTLLARLHAGLRQEGEARP